MLGYLARDDVDDPAHRVRAVQGRHRAANHLDAFDGGHRWHEAVQRRAETVGRHVAGHVLAAAIDQDQRVVAGHAADADVQPARLACAAAHVNAFHILQGFGQIAVVARLKVLARHHRHGGRRFFQFLLEAGRRHHHFFQ